MDRVIVIDLHRPLKPQLDEHAQPIKGTNYTPAPADFVPTLIGIANARKLRYKWGKDRFVMRADLPVVCALLQSRLPAYQADETYFKAVR